MEPVSLDEDGLRLQKATRESGQSYSAATIKAIVDAGHKIPGSQGKKAQELLIEAASLDPSEIDDYDELRAQFPSAEEIGRMTPAQLEAARERMAAQFDQEAAALLKADQAFTEKMKELDRKQSIIDKKREEYFEKGRQDALKELAARRAANPAVAADPTTTTSPAAAAASSSKDGEGSASQAGPSKVKNSTSNDKDERSAAAEGSARHFDVFVFGQSGKESDAPQGDEITTSTRPDTGKGKAEDVEMEVSESTDVFVSGQGQ